MLDLFFLLPEHDQLLVCLAICRSLGPRERSRQKLEILSEQQNHRCCYCGVRFADPVDVDGKGMRRWRKENSGNPHMASIEHVVRLVDGGKRDWANEVAACADCNQRRHHIDAHTFYLFRSAILVNIQKRRNARKNRKLSQKRAAKRRAKQNALATVADVWPGMVPEEGLAPPNGGV